MRRAEGAAHRERRPAGDDVRTRTIVENLPLVTRVARRYATQGEPLDDLVQAGTIGLIKAVDRFDPARGHPLSSLAVPAIEGEIRHHLRDRVPLVRPPRPVRELERRMRDVERELAARLRRSPTNEELSRALDVDAGAVAEALAARASAVPAELPPAIDDGGADGARAEARLLLERGWHVLDERERRILRLSFFDDLTQEQIAREVGVSQAQVSRLLRDALRRLRAELGDGVAPPETPAYSGAEMPNPPAQAEERPTHSGRLLLRMPQSLHAELAAAAEREGVSLNTLITGALASAIGWRHGGLREAAGPQEARPPEGRPDGAVERPAPRRLTSIALAANVVVVVVAVLLALALLVAALTQG